MEAQIPHFLKKLWKFFHITNVLRGFPGWSFLAATQNRNQRNEAQTQQLVEQHLIYMLVTY